jgi:hypothetical protein
MISLLPLLVLSAVFSAWIGCTLESTVKKVCARRRVVWYGADVCICVLQDQALLRARVAWADDDLDDDLEDIMASLKVAPLLPPPTFLFQGLQLAWTCWTLPSAAGEAGLALWLAA